MSDFETPKRGPIDRYLAQLPERCRPCKYAWFLINGLAFADESTGGPDGIITNINQRCSGYSGVPEHSIEDGGVQLGDIPADVEEAIDSNCGYIAMDRGRKE
ncbi:MAG TPA: hypothetical protein VMR34_01855 [Candidatus Saccharimonadales bacterium]|nr:hypothetical protein [Candidatus Saccharimonadales bacterium]